MNYSYYASNQGYSLTSKTLKSLLLRLLLLRLTNLSKLGSSESNLYFYSSSSRLAIICYSFY